jgi:para-aminobenzoate synthetase/4-amino-4-deoxychorismate lyase
VDLLRNDLGKICKYGSIRPEDEFSIEKYESLFQMVSTVRGKLKNKMDFSDIIKNIFPSGSVTGTPKIRTMEIIKDLEEEERGIYTGAIGMLSKKSSVFNVAIRTIKIDKVNGKGEVGLGSGIVWESEPVIEFAETKLKGEFLASPIKPFELIETMLVDNGKIFLFEQHLERLKKAAHYFLFIYNEKNIRKIIDKKLQEHISKSKFKLRLTLNKWGKVSIKTTSIMRLSKPVKVALSDRRVNGENTFQYFKTTNRGLYNEEFEEYRPKGFFDVIFLNEKEEITEGSITNILLKKNNLWVTPHISCGILPGIYREYFINTHTEIQETMLTLNDLLTAEELILVNSVRKEVKINQLVSGNEIIEYK